MKRLTVISVALSCLAASAAAAPLPPPPQQAVAILGAVKAGFQNGNSDQLTGALSESVVLTVNGQTAAAGITDVSRFLKAEIAKARAINIRSSVGFNAVMVAEDVSEIDGSSSHSVRPDCCVFARVTLYVLDPAFKVSAVHVLENRLGAWKPDEVR